MPVPRIIPTRVGTRSVGALPVALCQDHPHACGDKGIVEAVGRNRLGSSPRVWGQGFNVCNVTSENRIIPTRVGTSDFCCAHKLVDQDHPHACGDKGRSSLKIPCRLGSSPRVWGQVLVEGCTMISIGIIPTRVGTSLKKLGRTIKALDHPHACGDKSSFIEKIVTTMGSSPRVWGQVRSYQANIAKSGIIPTRVGTSR